LVLGRELLQRFEIVDLAFELLEWIDDERNRETSSTSASRSRLFPKNQEPPSHLERG